MFFSILHKRWRLTLICLCSGIGGGVRFPGCCTWLWNSEKTQGKSFVFQTWFVNERWLFVLLNQKVTIPPLRNVFLFGTISFNLCSGFTSIVQNCDHWGQQWASSSCESLWVQIASSSSFGSTPSGVATADHLQHLQRPQISLSLRSSSSLWRQLHVWHLLCSPPPPWLQLSWLLSEVIPACSQNSNIIMCLIILIYLFIYQY